VNRRTPWTAIIIVLVALACLAAVAAPSQAGASPLKSQLHRAQTKLKQARTRLLTAEAALVAAQSGGGFPGSTGGNVPPVPVPAPAPPTVGQLQARVAKAKKAVVRWNAKVDGLVKAYRQQQRLASWVSHSNWRPIIALAAAKYHVKADGMYRMMMRESAGQRYAGSSTSFKGLFQYYTGTWASSWNPWRHVNIYDPVAQINATAYAIHRGMGPSMWTTTWASCY
jgi:hypothetical protein